jgi:hypothetical protein
MCWRGRATRLVAHFQFLRLNGKLVHHSDSLVFGGFSKGFQVA